MELKWNGKGTEKEWKKNILTRLELQFTGMEWKWNGVEMETFQ